MRGCRDAQVDNKVGFAVISVRRKVGFHCKPVCGVRCAAGGMESESDVARNPSHRPHGHDILREAGIIQDQAAEAAASRPVKNLSKDTEAQLAVLRSCHQFDAHVAPYGEGGKRFKKAVHFMEIEYGITMVPRTMRDKVKELLDDHIKSENEHDGESGVERDLTHEEVYAFRQLMWPLIKLTILKGADS